MCDSCVPASSAPLRLSTNGCELGRVTLLIDSEEHGTVISVEVDVDQLTKAMRDARRAHFDREAARRERELVARLTLGRTVKGWVGTHKIRPFANALPYQVNGYWVELLEAFDEEVVDRMGPTTYQRVRVMFPNGYTAVLHLDQIIPLTEEDLGT